MNNTVIRNTIFHGPFKIDLYVHSHGMTEISHSAVIREKDTNVYVCGFGGRKTIYELLNDVHSHCEYEIRKLQGAQ